MKDEQFFKTVRDFLDVYLVKQKGYSKNTQKAYKLAINQLLDYFKEELKLPLRKIGFEQMTYTNICGYLAWLERSRQCGTQTKNQRLMAIRSFAKYASIIDPAKIHTQVEISNVPYKKEPERSVEHLDEDVLKVLLEQPDTAKSNGIRDQFFMLLMYDSAARCKELIGLTIGDVDLGKNPSITLLRKGEKIQNVPVSESVAAHFAEYLKMFHPQEQRSDSDFVFYTTIHGSRHQMSPDAVLLFMRKYAAKCRAVCPKTPKRIHPHILRHSRAMHLYRAGMPLVLLSEFLGHASVNTTRIYAWADTEMKRDAIAKASPENHSLEESIWKDSEDMIRRLYGLA